jgi:hypothetical protein
MFDELLNDKKFGHLKKNAHLVKKIQKLKNIVETKKNYISKVRKREIYVDSITNNILTNPNTTMTHDHPNNSTEIEKSISISHLLSKNSQAKISLSSLPNIHLPPKLPALSKKSENQLKITGNLPTITKELNQLLKLRNIKHCADKTEGRHGELVNSIDMILKRKKFMAEKEVEAGVQEIGRVKEQHDELIEDLNIENARCQERV